MKKLSEYAEILEKQSPKNLFPWLVDRGCPTVLTAYLQLSISVDIVDEMVGKTDDEVKTLIQDRIYDILYEALEAEEERRIGGG